MKNQTRESFYNRLQELGNVNPNATKASLNRSLGNLIDFKRASDGVAYGIIKENHNYYIKKGGIKENPDVSDFAYIGGLSNITKFQYKSLGEADKNRNMLLNTINEASKIKMVANGGGKRRLNEDKAGEEIAGAEQKLGDLDAATAASAEMGGDPAGGEIAGAFASEPTDNGAPAPEPTAEPAPAGDMGGGEPDLGGGAPDLGGGEETGAPDLGGGEPDLGGGEETAGEPDLGAGGDEMGGGAEVSEPLKELEKSIGKLTNTIRKTDLEPSQSKSYLKSLIQSFKDKLPEMEIEDRKEIANLLIKVVPPEDMADLSDSLPPEEHEVEEGCNECGSFAQYAESRGYGSVDALMECGEDEVNNLVSGYGNAHNDGMNDGDLEGVALVIKVLNPNMLDSLKNDYGHDDYAEKLTPHVDGMNESSDEDNLAKLNELFGGLKRLGQAAGNAIGGAAKNVGNAVAGGVQKAGQAVAGGVQKAGQAVAGAAQKGVQAAQQAGQAISQTYHSGEVAGEVKKLEGLANNLGAQVAALNTRLTKAGQQPVDVQKIIAGITNQVRAGKGANVAGTTAGSGIQRENTDPANVVTQPILKEDGDDDDMEGIDVKTDKPEIGFAPEGQSLGGGVVKPDGAPTTGLDINISPDKSVNISMNETINKLIEGLNELSTGLSNRAADMAGQASRDAANNNDPITRKFKAQQRDNFRYYVNPQIVNYFKGLGVEAISDGEGVKLEVPSNEGANLQIKVNPNGYDVVQGYINQIDPSLLKKIAVGIKKVQQDLQSPASAPASNELEETGIMNETELKVRKYIRKRLEEKAGLRKSTINENTKSPTLKRLDKLIDEQYARQSKMKK